MCGVHMLLTCISGRFSTMAAFEGATAGVGTSLPDVTLYEVRCLSDSRVT